MCGVARDVEATAGNGAQDLRDERRADGRGETNCYRLQKELQTGTFR